MTELPEDVARELDELFGADRVPDHAVTVYMLMKARGFSDSTWRDRLMTLVEEGTWERGRRSGSQSYWYWKKDEE